MNIMKKFLPAILALTTAISVTACSSENNNTVPQNPSNSSMIESSSTSGNSSVVSESNPDSSADDNNLPNTSVSENTEQGNKILVAYFSRVGNTNWDSGVDAVTSASLNVENGGFVGNAEYLAEFAQQATGGDLFFIQTEKTYPSDYRATTDEATVEQRNNARPTLASHVENMAQYDTIVLIYPNWWGTLPQALFTFLEEYDFSEKTILPLCTHGGSRMGSSESAISRLAPGAKLSEGLAVRGGDAKKAQSDVEKWINNSGIL